MVNGTVENLAPSQAFDPYAHGIASGHNDLWTPFLGPPSRPANPSPYSQKSTAKWNMPENYVGQSEYLRDTFEDYMLTAQYDWWTERIFPWYRTDQIHFEWTEWSNNAHYMGITPHQATSRVVTQKRTIRKASIVRRGIAAEFEIDFVATPMGRSSFMASLAQMARSVQETANVEVLRALLHCHRYQQIFVRKFGIVKDNDLDAWHDRQAERFMIAQKTPFGLEIVSDQMDAEKEQWGGSVQNQCWILSRDVMSYCSLVPPEKIYFDKGGQEAVDRVNGRRQNPNAASGTMGNLRSLQPERMIGDTPVFLAKSYHIDNVGHAELLSRVVEKGVYNLMVDRTTDFKRYRTEGRMIRVYDNDIDAWSDIELRDAIKHCGIWDAAGDLSNAWKSNNKRVATSSLQQDESDFLSHMSGKDRVNITRIGDMNKAYLSTDDLINAAQTVLNAVTHGDKADMKAALRITNLTGQNAIMERLQQLLPFDRTNIAAFDITDSAGKVTGRFTEITHSLMSATHIPAVKVSSVGSSASSSSSAPSLEQDHTKFLISLLGAAVPESHKDQLNAIASDSQKPWAERAKQVKQLILQCQKDDPTSVPEVLSSPKQVGTWFDKQAADHTRAIAAKMASMGASAASSASELNQEQDIHYFHVGSKVPAGFKAIHPEGTSAAKRMFGAHVGARGGGLLSGSGRPDDREKAVDVGNNLKENIDGINASGAPPMLRWLAIAYARTIFNRDTLMSLARNHIYVPIGFLLMRPHATYKTRFGIKCVMGGASGFTVFGHSNMMLEHEAARKVGMMHYTAYLSAVCTTPKNVHIIEDLFCSKYMGGMGVEFWSPEAYRNAPKRNRRSILCTALPPSTKKLEQRIDIRGHWHTELAMGLVAQERYESELFPGYARTCLIWGLMDKARKDSSSNRYRVAMNCVCYQGMQWHRNTTTDRFDDYIVEAGNFGPKVYPGCGKVRNGETKYLEDPGYSIVRG
jgi:hypothetical protein